MRWVTASLGCLALFFLVSAGCGGEDKPADHLVGSWLYVDSSDNSGFGINFAADGTYTASQLLLTSTTTANAQMEKGTYAADGKSLTTVPAEWTCTGPDPATTVSYTLNGDSFTIVEPSSIVSLKRNTQSADKAFIISLGCFDSGAFTKSPLSPVTP